MGGKSKILIIGATGYIGKFIVEASVKEGHPTFALVRQTSGDLYDHESLVKAIKQVDVVISALGDIKHLADQVKIIAAIKEAVNVKRFFPPKNIYSLNELVALWEKLIGKTLEKTYVTEEQLLKQIQEAPFPENTYLAIFHSNFVKGDQTNFEIDPSSFGVEASVLYPDVKYTTVEESLTRFV
ncbi:hypothetical protein CCACVL1_08934 [Corchorus capsularis]|uniref:NmrA-like domain-containing protein n=1 Tax=Corchorus capsularis TaxID=210143 RepID=A0A1R3IYA8_COCAP|nr:hypothetical protein CCACVL1_08934 [Corchorus capsularis]